MTKHNPEQIVATVLQSFPALAAAPSVKDICSAMVQAINDDRAQLDIGDAREIINRHDGQAVIWERGDIESVLDERINSRSVAAPSTRDEYDAIVDRAMGSAYWRGLNECSDRDWMLIDLALDEALTPTVQTPAAHSVDNEPVKSAARRNDV